MKVKFLSVALVMVMLIGLFGFPSQVQAVSQGASFVTSVTYQNVGKSAAQITIDFYPGGGAAPINFVLADLPSGAASSLYVGSVAGVSAGFKGAAVMNSSQPLVTTLVQVPQAPSTVKNRPLSSGFSEGAPYVQIPTVLKAKFNTNTAFSVQNVDTNAAELEVKFIAIEGTSATKTVASLGAGEAVYYDMSTETGMGSVFNGSVQIRAYRAGTSKGTPGSVVATSVEYSTVNDNVYAFEGAMSDGSTLYMPSAFCKYRGGLINSAYAVQNTGTVNASVTATYSSGAVDGPHTIAPGAKYSFLGCGANGTLNAAGFIGSAKIVSVGGKIVGIGKITGAGISSAFNGFTSGAEAVSLPYVRWAKDADWAAGTKQRSNIAVQNVGSSTIAAGGVKIKYYNLDGVLVGTDTNAAALAVGDKFSSNPSKISGVTEFGYYGSRIGGAAVVYATGGQLATVVRVETLLSGSNTVGEDYNGVPITLSQSPFAP